MAEHFVQPPHWEWYIAGYFFLAGLAGGSYAIATMLRLWGSKADEPIAAMGYLAAFPLVVACGVLLTIDLGQPLRFWHMMIDTTPGASGLNFKYWSPISIGTWALLIFGIFSFVSYLDARGTVMRLPVAFGAAGSVFALFITAYTGVVLSVSNQPLWSDTWTLGGLFVASGLCGSAALLLLLSAYEAAGTPAGAHRLRGAESYFAVLEVVMIALFFASLAPAGAMARALEPLWVILWILVVVSLVPAALGLANHRRDTVATGAGSIVIAQSRASSLVVPAVVLAGAFLLRVVVIFSAQF
jgi:formate-dependent nitrite reductase membrane component NrfD